MEIYCKKRLPIDPSRESLVSDIPAGDGKIANLFYSVCGSVRKMWMSVVVKGSCSSERWGGRFSVG